MLSARNEDDIPPGSPARTRLEVRVVSDDRTRTNEQTRWVWKAISAGNHFRQRVAGWQSKQGDAGFAALLHGHEKRLHVAINLAKSGECPAPCLEVIVR